MIWAGKAVAGILGAMIGGPIAGLLAAGVGHGLDREIDGYARAFGRRTSRAWQRHWHEVLFVAEFVLAGHLARVGRLTAAASDSAFQSLRARHALSVSKNDEADALFRDGLRSGFPVTEFVNQVRRELHRRADLMFDLFDRLLFVKTCIVSASADPARVNDALLDVARYFDLSEADLIWVEQIVEAQRRQEQVEARGAMDLDDAYSTLGVARTASKDEIKLAYRRQMSRHHPDKLIHQQPSSEQLAQAASRTDRVHKAYETLRRRHGWT